MADIETFRRDTTAWLETNCPASMRTPGGEEEAVWGGRNATYTNPDSKLWLDRMAEKSAANLLAGLELPDFAAMQPAATLWVDTVANVRNHRETHQRPIRIPHLCLMR